MKQRRTGAELYSRIRLIKRAQMPRRRWRLNIYVFIGEGLLGNLGNRYKAIKSFKNPEKKWKRDLKALKKNKILYSMENHTSSCIELNKIFSKVINKYESSSSDSSSRDSYSSIYSESEWDELRQTN